MQQLNTTTSHWLILILVLLSKFRLVFLRQAQKHCYCVQLPKHKPRQLKRACCKQILWWGDIKQVPRMTFSYCAIRTDIQLLKPNLFTNVNPTVGVARSKWAAQKYTTQLTRNTTLCVCFLLPGEKTLEKKKKKTEDIVRRKRKIQEK